MAQELKQLRVKIFDELSKIVDPEINTTITELDLEKAWTKLPWAMSALCTLICRFSNTTYLEAARIP